MLTVKVTRKDINDGQRRNCSLCPLATAIRRAYSKAGVSARVRVGLDTFELTLPGKPSVWLELPVIGAVWTRAYDGHVDVQPFTFQLPDHR